MDRSLRRDERRRERRALARVVALRKSSDDETSYLSLCRCFCTEKGLETNLVRSVVWRHVVLGLSTLRTVPLVCESIASRSLSSSPSPLPESLSPCPRPLRGAAALSANDFDSDCASCSDSCSAGNFVSSSSSNGNGNGAAIPENCQPRVIDVDVERSLWALYPDAERRAAMRAALKAMLLRILAGNAERHYYQGLHELVGFVMYVMDPAAPTEVMAAVCERLLQSQWRSFSDQRLSQSQSMLYAMHAVVASEDVELAAALEDCGVAPESHYAVAWLITWYTHVCDDTAALARLFDFLICGDNEQTVVFFTAALVLHARERILAWIHDKGEDEGEEGEEGEGDRLVRMSRVYTQLSRLPRDVLCAANAEAMEKIIARAIDLRRCHAALAMSAREDFLAGRVTRLGLLADARTRNSALRLLWRHLFREWRRPWRSGGRAWPFVAAALVAASAVAFRYAAAHFNSAGA